MSLSIEVKNLTKKYKDFTLNNVSFNLPKGSIMGFIGQNGAGKSTTIKLLLNLCNKDSGDIKIFGLNNIENEKDIKQNIGVVFSQTSFHDNLIIPNIAKIMSKIYDKWDEKVFDGYINRFKLPKDKIFKEFSTGMKMKLAIAVALSHHAKLLILDEATSGLDPVVRNEILDVFLDFIQDEENSILISSHITTDLEKICDYITYINNGNIVLSEDKDELLNNCGIIRCGLLEATNIDEKDYISSRKNKFGFEALVKNKDEKKSKYKDLVIDNVTLEDIMLFYSQEGK